LSHLWPTGSSWDSSPRLRPGTSPHALRIPPRGGHPALRRKASGGFRFALAVSDFRLRARLGFSIPASLSGRRGITPVFGYGAPHLDAEGTPTLLTSALPSAHYGPVRQTVSFAELRLAARPATLLPRFFPAGLRPFPASTHGLVRVLPSFTPPGDRHAGRAFRIGLPPSPFCGRLGSRIAVYEASSGRSLVVAARALAHHA
jgi:hypothetical protein